MKITIAGLKAGKDMAETDLATVAYMQGAERYKTKWHSPDEHIDKDKVVLGIFKLCNKLRYSLVQWNGEWWYQYGTYNAEVRLIKWYEIPKFEEE